MADDSQQQIPTDDIGDENSPSTPIDQNPESTERPAREATQETETPQPAEEVQSDTEEVQPEADVTQSEPTDGPEVIQPEQNQPAPEEPGETIEPAPTPENPTKTTPETPTATQTEAVDIEKPVSDLSEQRFYPVENLESQESLDNPPPNAPNQDATNATQPDVGATEEPKKSRFKNRGAIIAIVATGLLITGLAAVTQLRQGGTSDDTLSKFTEQTVPITISDAVSSPSFETLQDQLVVNGALTVTTSSGSSVSLSAANVSGSQIYTFPDDSGVLCLDSNNCGFVSEDNPSGNICLITNNCGFLSQGGNSFGEDLVVGTNDGFDLGFKTGGTVKTWILESNGGLAFGTAKDVSIYRGGTNLLETDDNFMIGGSVSIGADAIVSECGPLIDECDSLLNVSEVNRSVSTATPVGGIISLTLDPATAPSYSGLASAIGAGIGLTVAKGNTADFSGKILAGSFSQVSHEGSGDVSALVGNYTIATNTESADVAVMAGVFANSNNAGTGTVGQNVGVYVLTSAGTGTIDKNIGLLVDSQSIGTEDYGIAIGTADTQTLWIGNDVDSTTANAGIGFGVSKDTNLYRSAADTLKTDDSLSVGTSGAGAYQLDVETNSSGSYVANFFNDGDTADRYGLRVQAGADDGSGTTYYLDAYDGNGDQVGYIANTSGTFALTDISDARTKTNIADSGINALEILSGLRVVDFNRNQNPGGPTITGFIAQEVLGIYAPAVSQSSTGLYGIQKDAFIPVLVKGVQQQQVDINDIARRVATLESSGGQLDVNVAQLDVDKLTVATAKVTGSLEVAGSAAIAGNVDIGGDLSLDGKVVGNTDTRGAVTVAAGSTEVYHSFNRAFTSAPNVILTATSEFAPSFRVESSKTGFTVYFQESQGYDVKLNYQIQQ